MSGLHSVHARLAFVAFGHGRPCDAIDFSSDFASVTSRFEQQTEADGLATDNDFASAIALVPSLSWSPAANVRIVLLVLGDPHPQDDDNSEAQLSSSKKSLAALSNLKIHCTFFNLKSVDHLYGYQQEIIDTLPQRCTLFSAQRRFIACANSLPAPFEPSKQSLDVTDLYVPFMFIS
jgi:hypothetical protein